MAHKKPTKRGRPRSGTEQRSVRIKDGVWTELERLAQHMNQDRDHVMDGRITPSTLVNAALRDYLMSRGRGAVYAEPRKKAVA